MATTYTSQLRLALLGSGNKDVWGGLENNQALLAENALTGMVTVDVTTSDVTLTRANGAEDQARYAVVRAIGAPAATKTVIFPSITKLLVAINDTSPIQPVKFATSVGGVTLTTSTPALLWVDSDKGTVRTVAAGLNAVPTPTVLTTYGNGLIPTNVVAAPPTSPVTLDLKAVVVGSMVYGVAKFSGVGVINAATLVFDTSPYITSTLSPPYTCDFPVNILEGGSANRDSYLRIPSGGADWSFIWGGGAYGNTTKIWYSGYLPFFYPLV